MPTEVLRIETPAHFDQAVAAAAALLQRGEVVAVPTETVYGLAANAWNPEAVARIYAAKGRPSHNPIIVHVASLAMARACVRSWPAEAAALSNAYWPGPLTLVLPRSDKIPAIVTAGGDTVGVRWPAHPFMRALIQACGFPIAAPSANPANQLSPTTGEHVFRSLGAKIPLVVDAGPSSVGIESTVIDLTVSPPAVLRAGMISASQLGATLHREVQVANHAGSALKSPGLLQKHYAPRAKLFIRKWRDDAELNRLAGELQIPFSQISVLAHDQIPRANPFGRVAIIPHDAEAYARALYAELHLCDDAGARVILVEEAPPGPEWQGIRDRLKRASAAD